MLLEALDLIAVVEDRWQTLGRILFWNLVFGEVRHDGVYLVLRPLAEEDRVIVEDTPLRAALDQMPCSPGPWRIRYSNEEALMAAVARWLGGGSLARIVDAEHWHDGSSVRISEVLTWYIRRAGSDLEAKRSRSA
jgi:hypothetical protein